MIMKIWNRCCCCWPLRCVCKPKPDPVKGSFTAVKYDQETGLPLAGAAYTLYQNGSPVATATSDRTGKLSFAGLVPGEYTLVETAVPDGYLPERTSHQVMVGEDGSVTIDGSPAENFPLYDLPNGDAEVSFLKVDANTGLPLEGAVFELSNGVRAASGSDGVVDFGIFGPGTYTFREITAPQGYIAAETEFTVHVTTGGKVFINGTPLETFTAKNVRIPAPSRPPVINTVLEADFLITGTGIPGASIAVRLADGVVVNAEVTDAGTWFVIVPSGTYLRAGQVVYAVQTEPGHTPSEEAAMQVQARP